MDLGPIIGPFGALFLAVPAIVFLARDHRDRDKQRDVEHAEAIAFERSRTREAEARLDSFRETMRESTNVTERAVALAEASADRSGSRRYSDRGRDNA